MREHIADPLEVKHWPPAAACPQCSRLAAYRIAGLLWCVSSACDPRGLTWRALDRYFREHPTIEINDDDAASAPIRTASKRRGRKRRARDPS